MKKLIVILAVALLVFGAQPMHAQSWWSTVTNWFNEKPALAISATALTVAVIGWFMYKKIYKTPVSKVDKETQTNENQVHPVDEVKRPELRVNVLNDDTVKKATNILHSKQEIESLICEDLPGKKEAYLVGLEIKNQVEKLLSSSRVTADSGLKKAFSDISNTSEADYVRGREKQYHFYQAVETLVYAARAHYTSLD